MSAVIDKNNEVVKIMMRRDGLCLDDAIEITQCALDEALESVENGGDPEESWMMNTGLESDYLFDLMMMG